ncbi:MAG: YebC/PmpR family DNA-binding transcriptional regulator [Candidatus Pacebacteria bacterium]|nr:YebC/PmpR family DNA-binding transcriptional regulator [Candidatus Paceibacterota bacterium]
MSGHSHWHSIKFKKGVEDAKRSKVFSKLSKEISISAREGGSDLTFNPKLRSIVEKARGENMPADSIEKAIKKGSGELEGYTLEEFTIEAYGPDGVAMIIEGITDNKNRSLGEIKLILNQQGGKMVEGGAIKWMFERRGVILINKDDLKKDKEDMEILAIESGADDFRWEEEGMVIYTKSEDLEKTRKFLEEKRVKMISANLEWVPKETVVVDEKTREKCQKLFDALDDHDDVQNIFWNI